MPNVRMRWTLAMALIAASWLSGCGSGTPGQNLNEWMGSILPPKPGDVARDAVNPYDPDLRRKSLQALGKAAWGGEEPYMRLYRMLVDDPDPTVRAAALAALGKHGTQEDIDRVLPYLEYDTDNKIVRWEAAKALQRLHREDAATPLTRSLADDEDADVRMACADALGQYHVRPVFQALVGALTDRDYGVVQQSRASLVTLTGQDFGDDGRAWLEWAKGTDNLFANASTYYYPQFSRPRTTFEKIQFWKEAPQVNPQEPRS